MLPLCSPWRSHHVTPGTDFQATGEKIWVTVASRWHSCCQATGKECFELDGLLLKCKSLASKLENHACPGVYHCIFQIFQSKQPLWADLNVHLEHFVFSCGVNRQDCLRGLFKDTGAAEAVECKCAAQWQIASTVSPLIWNSNLLDTVWAAWLFAWRLFQMLLLFSPFLG